MEFFQRGGGPNFFGIYFSSIEIQIWGRPWAINTYFWIQTLGGKGDKIHTYTVAIINRVLCNHVNGGKTTQSSMRRRKASTRTVQAETMGVI